jgi:hypothetical protein
MFTVNIVSAEIIEGDKSDPVRVRERERERERERDRAGHKERATDARRPGARERKR